MPYRNTGSTACVALNDSPLSTVKSYAITRKTSQPHSGVTSNSRAGTLAVAGALDWSASCVSWALVPPIVPGQGGTFKGCQGGGCGETDFIIQEGACVCSELSTTIDIKTRAPIEWNYTFQGNGALEESTQDSRMIDTTTPMVVRPKTADFVVKKADKDGSSDITIDDWNLAQISFTMSSEVSGGGATSSSNGWLKRLAGPMNFTFEMTFENDRLADLNFDVDDELSFKIALDNGKEINVSWIHITGFGEATLDNSSAEPISIPASGTMSAYSLNGGGYGTVEIGGVQVWPACTYDT